MPLFLGKNVITLKCLASIISYHYVFNIGLVFALGKQTSKSKHNETHFLQGILVNSFSYVTVLLRSIRLNIKKHHCADVYGRCWCLVVMATLRLINSPSSFLFLGFNQYLDSERSA